ncbi:hypothetical protein ACJMK2_003666 [Sinanodonta woodiana]|uniref:P2X purinoreceptor 7 intracellular domain-containing protein n=1 Tax=Sinanodonta woodiana TaxID=1069815 RepID=A0ABD3XYW4_SINWO
MEAESSDGSPFSRCSSGNESDSEGYSQRGTKKRGRGRASGAGGRARGAGHRARGAGRRGRGVSSRARGTQYGPALPTRADRAQMLRQERDEQLRERVSHLTDEGRQDLLCKIVEAHPQFVFDILMKSTEEQQGGYHPAPGVTALDWCRCTHCREMPSDEEKMCCNQLPMNCLSRLQDFDLVVLDEVVLGVAQLYRQDVFALDQDEDYNKGKRHTAYRQFILWYHGYLDAGNIRVIPSCCVWKIRDKYPDHFGQYTGFMAGRLE